MHKTQYMRQEKTGTILWENITVYSNLAITIIICSCKEALNLLFCQGPRPREKTLEKEPDSHKSIDEKNEELHWTVTLQLQAALHFNPFFILDHSHTAH